MEVWSCLWIWVEIALELLCQYPQVRIFHWCCDWAWDHGTWTESIGSWYWNYDWTYRIWDVMQLILNLVLGAPNNFYISQTERYYLLTLVFYESFTNTNIQNWETMFALYINKQKPHKLNILFLFFWMQENLPK